MKGNNQMKNMVMLSLGIIMSFCITSSAQVAPPGSASRLPPIDFNKDFLIKKKQQFPCNASNEMSARQKAFCDTPVSLADIAAGALNAPDVDAQGRPVPIDAKHARNLALASMIMNSEAPLDLTQSQRDDIREALFYAYKGQPWQIFPACIMIESETECAIAPGK